jgi:hypothetical protein
MNQTLAYYCVYLWVSDKQGRQLKTIGSMIYESGIWKLELKKEIQEFQSFLDDTDLNYDEEFEINEVQDAEERDMIEVAFIKLQKFAIYTSIITRKLIEANKISDELLGCNFPIMTYPKSNNEDVTPWNGYEIEKLYSLDKPSKSNISIKDLVDSLIHSFHFMPKWDWHKIDEDLDDEDPENWEVTTLLGIHFSSDKTKEKTLSYIDFKIYLKALTCVTKDMIRQVETRKGKVIKKSTKIFSNPDKEES